MYPPSNNNCNYSSILSSLICQSIPASPCMQYEHELYFQTYHHDDQYNYLQQQQQVPFIEDLSVHILADSCTESTVAKPSNCTDNVIITRNHILEGIEEGGGEGRGENKGNDVMSSRISIFRGRISKNNKRSSNKDRHSKINTARGPRDRRMRLSLDAARKFFRLQDLLGFDKASKTVEWLLTKSDSAIEELAAKANEGAQLPHINKQISCSTTTTTGIGTSNSISESCEVISGTDETSSNDKNKETAKDEKKKKKKKKANTARRAAFEPLTRESRNQARARARERTNTKKMSQIGKSKAPAHDLNPSGSRRPINKTCEEPGTHEQLNFHQENNIDECNLVVNGTWNPFSIFSYHEQNAGISNEHQLVTDFQFCGKLWEG